MTTSDTRYVMILEIQRIVDKTSAAWNASTRTNEDVASRSKHDVARIVISDSNLNRLLNRGTQHLALVHDEEIEEDTKIGRPRA